MHLPHGPARAPAARSLGALPQASLPSPIVSFATPIVRLSLLKPSPNGCGTLIHSTFSIRLPVPVPLPEAARLPALSMHARARGIPEALPRAHREIPALFLFSPPVGAER